MDVAQICIHLQFTAMLYLIFNVDFALFLDSYSLDGLLMVLFIGLRVFLMHLHHQLTLPYC